MVQMIFDAVAVLSGLFLILMLLGFIVMTAVACWNVIKEELEEVERDDE